MNTGLTVLTVILRSIPLVVGRAGAGCESALRDSLSGARSWTGNSTTPRPRAGVAPSRLAEEMRRVGLSRQDARWFSRRLCAHLGKSRTRRFAVVSLTKHHALFTLRFALTPRAHTPASIPGSLRRPKAKHNSPRFLDVGLNFQQCIDLRSLAFTKIGCPRLRLSRQDPAPQESVPHPVGNSASRRSRNLTR